MKDKEHLSPEEKATADRHARAINTWVSAVLIHQSKHGKNPLTPINKNLGRKET